MRCAAHPEVETTLSCSKCGKPICPKCMVETPVGARCPDCAQVYRLPTFQVSTRYLLIATGVGLGMATICGLIWGVLGSFLGFRFFNIVLAAGVGYAIGEAISLSVNRKRGPKLAIIAGFAVAISYLVSISLWGFGFQLFDLLAIAVGIYVAVNRLR